MFQRYVLLSAVMLGLAFPVFAQTTATSGNSAQTSPVFSGPSAAGDMKRAKGDFAGAILEYNTEIAKIDAEAKRIAKLKNDYLTMSEFDRMSANQDEATKNYPEWAKLYYGRAMANIGLGKKTEAKADLDLAISLDNTMADAYYQRAMIVNTKEDREPACQDLSRAVALGSEAARSAYDDNFCWQSANQHYKAGCSKVTVRAWDEAITELNAAIAMCPDSGNYFAKRGQAYSGKGDKVKAVADFNKAIQLSPNNPDGYYQLGIYYFGEDEFDLAFDNLTKAINITPTYEAYMTRAQVCERQSKFTSACYDYGQAISLRPQDPEAYYRRALVERDMKDMTKACKDFTKASSLGNQDATEFLKECN
jgi:tetratricopeptide (TPR) repeat protein